MNSIVKRFDRPDEVRTFARGRFEIVTVAGSTFGRAIYEPGWKWSEHVGAQSGSRYCQVEHVGFVVGGTAAVLMEDGEEILLRTGDLFWIAPGHDSWVVGDELYTSIHLVGAQDYAAAKPK
jgi:hypothetical protein